MTSVWYTGLAVRRLITASDWARRGISAYDAEWKRSNGWSIPESEFTTPQLLVLESMDDFLLGAPDGPRDGLPIQPEPDPDPEEGVGVSFVSDIDGLVIYFGHGPLPDPASVANTVYFLLPQ